MEASAPTVDTISSPDEQNATTLVGLGVGGGDLVVPAANTVQAWRIVP
jgi:hypothetical protein